MYFINPQLHTRRAFLRRSGQLALTGTALPFALNLAAMGEAAAFNATDYKALVCVFLYGGNDYANTVVAYDDASYNRYSAIRGGGAGQAAGGIALGKAALTPTLLTPGTAPKDIANLSRQYAFHPSMTGLSRLFNAGKAAVQLNVGPLVVPLTRAQYDNDSTRASFPLPPKLFSHNDQQSVWQSSSPEGSTVGWGGNIGDLALSSNGGNALFTCISMAGNAVFLSGDSALQYQVSTNGAIKIDAANNNVYGSAAVKSAINTLITQNRAQNVLENDYNAVTRRAITAESTITSALATAPASGAAYSGFPPSGNSLANQLKMVARLIASRSTVGAARQVFFVSIGGNDLHDNLISDQADVLGKVSAAMTAFHDATAALGVADKVTAFTASDFGRTLTSNGNGSDHGWGSHHLMVGGAVRGAAFYGTPPPLSVTDSAAPEDQWHVGYGRLLPSTSVDQYAATLAKWFGVADAEMSGILPSLKNFGVAAGRPDYPENLGFMA